MAGQRTGYIRVSTLDQQTERQLDGIALDQTFTDKASGKDTKRPQLELMLRFARRGDTVVVHSMDRLARNLDDLRRIVHTLTGKGVRIAFVKEQLTFTGEDSPMASLLLSVMGAFADDADSAIMRSEVVAIQESRGLLGCGASHNLGARAGSPLKQVLRWGPRDLGGGRRVEERCDQRIGCLEPPPTQCGWQNRLHCLQLLGRIQPQINFGSPHIGMAEP